MALYRRGDMVLRRSPRGKRRKYLGASVISDTEDARATVFGCQPTSHPILRLQQMQISGECRAIEPQELCEFAQRRGSAKFESRQDRELSAANVVGSQGSIVDRGDRTRRLSRRRTKATCAGGYVRVRTHGMCRYTHFPHVKSVETDLLRVLHQSSPLSSARSTAADDGSRCGCEKRWMTCSSVLPHIASRSVDTRAGPAVSRRSGQSSTMATASMLKTSDKLGQPLSAASRHLFNDKRHRTPKRRQRSLYGIQPRMMA